MAVTLDQVRRLLNAEEPEYSAAARLGPQILPHLKSLIAGKEKLLASKAAYLSGLIDHGQAADVLKSAAASPHPVVRIAAAVSARRAKRPAAGVLSRLLNDKDAGVRKLAVKASAVRPNAALLKQVSALSHRDPSSGIRALAGRALAFVRSRAAKAAGQSGELGYESELAAEFTNETATGPSCSGGSSNCPSCGAAGVTSWQGEEREAGLPLCEAECARRFLECTDKNPRGGTECEAIVQGCLRGCAQPRPSPGPIPIPPFPPSPPSPLSAPPTVRLGSRGPAVVELQRRLNRWLTLNPQIRVAPLNPDGAFGPLTDSAVRIFQQVNRLTVDGVVGPMTWGALLTF